MLKGNGTPPNLSGTSLTLTGSISIENGGITSKTEGGIPELFIGSYDSSYAALFLQANGELVRFLFNGTKLIIAAQNDPISLEFAENITLDGFLTLSSSYNLTAHAGGGQGSALQLVAAINEVSTVATIAASVALPVSVPGTQITVTNAAVLSMQVFGVGSDTINGIASGTGIAQAGATTYTYSCPAAGKWYRQT